MNREAMLAVADVIEWADKRFDLSNSAVRVYGDPEDDDYEMISDPKVLWEDCGTAGCVWGWTNAWADQPLQSDQYAARELGLTYEEGERLFYWDQWSIWVKLADKYGWKLSDWGDIDKPSEITAKQAAEVLRMIANGEVEL